MDYLALLATRFTVFASSAADCKKDQTAKLLGIIPKWYEYLPYTPAPKPVEGCSVGLSLLGNIGSKANGATAFNSVLLIGLAILDMLMHVAGVIAIAFVVYGGIQYITSQGEPDRVEKAKSTLINALVGLVIVIIAVPVVAFAGKTLGG